MLDGFPLWLKRVIIILMFIIVSTLIYSIFSFCFKLSLKKLSPNHKDYNRKMTMGSLIISSFKYLMVIIVIIGILVICGVKVSAIITGAGLVSIAVGFGAQSLVNDVISGMFIFFEKQYDVGDTVMIEDFTGEVTSLGFKSTVLKNWVGDIFVIGNGKINSIINYSQANSVALVKVKVNHDTDFDNLRKVVESSLLKIMNEVDYITQNPIYKGVTEITSSGVQIMITAQTEPMRHFEAERIIRKELIEIFDKENIEFSYPKIEYRSEKNVRV
ncbi:MAG: mechanosensitive ion channel family protein [Bacilli bacterium]